MGAGTAWVLWAWSVFLLCRPGQGQDQVPGLNRSAPARCGPEQLVDQETKVLRCCNRCDSNNRPCPSDKLRDCTCTMPGVICEDTKCTNCVKHTCSSGQRALFHGSFLPSASCEDCEDGTYSDGIYGKCLPWTNCAREGFLIVRPGNRTHNVLCGMAPLPESGLFSFYSIPVAILTCLATITFLLVIIQLVLHIWWVKKEPFTKDREPILPLGLGPPDDIGNCPFPEEEWGEKTADDKAHPWV